MLRRALIWIMLIALPLQGFAAAAMLHCPPSHHAPSTQAAGHHDGHDHASTSAHEHHADSSSAHQHEAKASADKCSACHSCCMGVISLVGFQSNFLLPAGAQVLAPHPVGTLSSVILEGLQRPPRPSFA